VLLDVDQFRERTAYDLDRLVSDLQDETRRGGASEASAWRTHARHPACWSER
jgi:hypothetical protein